MKGLIAVVISCIVSAAIVIAVVLRGPSWAWWHNPYALGVLTVTAPLLVAIMAPRSWWRT